MFDLLFPEQAEAAHLRQISKSPVVMSSNQKTAVSSVASHAARKKNR